ncbi:MAG: hypothetical protein AB8U25_01905 [Rickettsiales endosymbiont of Dermacentor nuttalli]
MSVRSKLYKGSTFYFSLKIAILSNTPIKSEIMQSLLNKKVLFIYPYIEHHNILKQYVSNFAIEIDFTISAYQTLDTLVNSAYTYHFIIITYV